VGVGSSTPWAELAVTNAGTNPSFIVEDSVSPDLSPFLIDATGNVGIGTTSPQVKLHLYGSTVAQYIDSSAGSQASVYFLSDGVGKSAIYKPASSDDLRFWTGTAGDSLTMRNTNGYFGVGTTTPFRRLSLTDAVSTAQTAIAYDTTRYTDLLTDSVGDFTINPQGDDVRLNDDNMWVCAGGSCPTGTPSGNGNLIVESKIGLGTSTPNTPLTIQAADNSSFLNFTAAGNTRFIMGTDASGNVIGYTGNSVDLRFGSSSSPIQLVIKGNSGKVGIGTTTPTEQFSIQDRLYVGANGATGMGTATSTFQGDIKITGKLDVGTIDPVYTIGGVKYATYGASTVGITEEVLTTIQLTKNSEGKYENVIAFDALEKGSDLWLFYQVTTFGEEWEHLVVSATPSFDGRVFYKKNKEANTLTITGTEEGEVSLRLAARRYDNDKWPNLRPDQDDEFTHHTLEEKKPATFWSLFNLQN
jgi:hypothetical protein